MAHSQPTKRDRDTEGTAAEDQRPAKRISNISDFDNLVTVLVGPEEKRFTLHQDLVCAKSKFFKAACSTRWLEGQQKIVRQPKVKPEVFQVYCEWIYSGDNVSSTCNAESTREVVYAEFLLLIDLYLLGDSLDDLDLRNRTTHELLKSMTTTKSWPYYHVINHIWNSTPAESLFRKMLVDFFVANHGTNDFAQTADKYPHEFIKDIAVASLQKLPAGSMIYWTDLTTAVQGYLEVKEAKDNTT